MSLLILRSLKAAGLTLTNQTVPEVLSPSFYQPATLYEYSNLIPVDSRSILEISAQFNHFHSWAILDEYQTQCLAHLATSTNKNEFLLYAQKRIQASDRKGAIDVLESCKASQWPEVYRILSRLLMDTDPTRSLAYAEIAISLGDLVSSKLKSQLLDRVASVSPIQISSTRLMLISQLLSKLDPGYAANAGRCEALQNQGFISFITGILNCHISHLKLFLKEKWRLISVQNLREQLLLPANTGTCIVCLAPVSSLGVQCPNCDFMVCIYIVSIP